MSLENNINFTANEYVDVGNEKNYQILDINSLPDDAISHSDAMECSVEDIESLNYKVYCDNPVWAVTCMSVGDTTDDGTLISCDATGTIFKHRSGGEKLSRFVVNDDKATFSAKGFVPVTDGDTMKNPFDNHLENNNNNDDEKTEETDMTTENPFDNQNTETPVDPFANQATETPADETPADETGDETPADPFANQATETDGDTETPADEAGDEFDSLVDTAKKGDNAGDGDTLEGLMGQADKAIADKSATDEPKKMNTFGKGKSTRSTRGKTAGGTGSKNRSGKKSAALTSVKPTHVDSPDRRKLQELWHSLGRFVAFVVPTDKRTTFVTPSVALKEKSDITASSSASTENRKSIAALKDAKNIAENIKPYILPKYNFKIKESRPAKATAVILEVPAFLDRLTNAGNIASYDDGMKEVDKDYKATQFIMLPIGEFEQVLHTLGPIQEHDATALDDVGPRTIEASLKLTKNLTYQSRIGYNINGSYKNPIHDNNYFPLATYDCVDLFNDSLSADDADLYNKAYFDGYFSPISRSPKNSSSKIQLVESKHDCLTDSFKDVISSTETNGVRTISSKVFQAGGIVSDADELFKVSSFYNADVLRDELLVPVKEAKATKDGTGIRYVFVKFDLLKPEESDAYLSGNSRALTQFEHIVELFEDPDSFLSVSKLQQVASKSKKGSGKFISGTEAISVFNTIKNGTGKNSGSIDYEFK